MEFLFDFHDVEDESSNFYGLTYEEVVEMICDHNNCYDTGYASISEFNAGEEFYQFVPSGIVRLDSNFNFHLN